MEHPVALDDHLGILEHQAAVSERPEVRLPLAEDDRHDVDRHMIDPTRVITSLPRIGWVLGAEPWLPGAGVPARTSG